MTVPATKGESAGSITRLEPAGSKKGRYGQAVLHYPACATILRPSFRAKPRNPESASHPDQCCVFERDIEFNASLTGMATKKLATERSSP
jgi:hypothetical protein